MLQLHRNLGQDGTHTNWRAHQVLLCGAVALSQTWYLVRKCAGTPWPNPIDSTAPTLFKQRILDVRRNHHQNAASTNKSPPANELVETSHADSERMKCQRHNQLHLRPSRMAKRLSGGGWLTWFRFHQSGTYGRRR